MSSAAAPARARTGEQLEALLDDPSPGIFTSGATISIRLTVIGAQRTSVERQLDVIELLIAECWRTRPDDVDRRIHPITSGGLERRMEPIGRWLEPALPC